MQAPKLTVFINDAVVAPVGLQLFNRAHGDSRSTLFPDANLPGEVGSSPDLVPTTPHAESPNNPQISRLGPRNCGASGGAISKFLLDDLGAGKLVVVQIATRFGAG